MRRKFIIFLALLSLIAFQACKSEAPAGGGNGQPQNNSDGSLIDWMKAKQFSYDYEIVDNTAEQTASSSATGLKGKVYVKGNDILVETTMDLPMAVTAVKILKTGSEIYMIIDQTKSAMKIPSSQEALDAVSLDYSVMQPSENGEGEILGKTLPYTGYSLGQANVKFYTENGAVSAIETLSSGNKVIMTVKNPSSNVPPDIFKVPEGYTITDFVF